MPAVPPYSSTTIARWWPSRRISDSAEQHPLGAGHHLHLAGDLADADGAAGDLGREQVAHVHEADDVVVRSRATTG